MNDRLSWDQYFMMMVYLVAMRSEDESSHIGAVIVDVDNVVISTGYNGLPYGVFNTLERQERPEKYFWFEHAERNAIYLGGSRVKYCKMYTNGIPCADCARGIIQSRISEVIVDEDWYREDFERWKESATRSEIMFEEAKVHVRQVKVESTLNILKYRNGKYI